MAMRKTSLSVLNRTAQSHPKTINSLQIPALRCFAAAASQDKGKSNRYVSPYKEVFDGINEGKTFLGTQELKRPETRYLKCGIPEDALRFKTIAYGRLLEEPYVMPNEHRVTLQVPIRDLPLNDVEMVVLKEIVGTRLNETKGLLQLSSVQFGSRIENKRHVVSMLERIVHAAKELAKRLPEKKGETQGEAIES